MFVINANAIAHCGAPVPVRNNAAPKAHQTPIATSIEARRDYEMEPETAAFGYLRERLFSEQRVFDSDLWLSRDMRRVVYRRAAVSCFSRVAAGAFVPKSLIATTMFHSVR